jgi:hypothetical protein
MLAISNESWHDSIAEAGTDMYSHSPPDPPAVGASDRCHRVLAMRIVVAVPGYMPDSAGPRARASVNYERE